MLKPYRVMDLSNGGSMFCGRILADLGADVVKIETPGGDASRSIGPFYHDIHDPDKSLYWFAYNLGKRNITLDLTTAEGRDIFRKLAAKTDCIIESFKPGFLDSLELGYKDLSKINPGIILTSITPYGQTGPYADYKASDITLVGMGGLSYITGYANGEPMRATAAQSELIAGSQAAAATMIALFHRALFQSRPV
jgi:benzylsuccinate CoA-transferase BbsE subunit